jgi:hypothetical protein
MPSPPIGIRKREEKKVLIKLSADPLVVKGTALWQTVGKSTNPGALYS